MLEPPSEALLISAIALDAGQRIDVFAASHYEDLSRAEAQRLIDLTDEGCNGIRVNGLRVKANYRLRAGDVVSLIKPEESPSAAQAESIPLDIVFEDSSIIVVNKARGMVVHPAPGSKDGTLVNAVLGHGGELSEVGGALRPGIVHRLDKDTGGLLVVAKSNSAHRSLQAQIQARTAVRQYRALVWGSPSFERATIDAPIGRHPADRKKMAVITDTAQTARSAVTELSVVKTYHTLISLVEAKLQTGRTHQIRVHCAYAHHPVVGDPLYGGSRNIPAGILPAGTLAALKSAIYSVAGQALHAVHLEFDHPATGKRMEFNVPVARVIQDVIDVLDSAG